LMPFPWYRLRNCCRNTFLMVGSLWRSQAIIFINGFSDLDLFHGHYPTACRSQWPHGLRHELSSLDQTLGSWVRIPLETWKSVCVHSVCVLVYR
jgi:hypothetical protein